jgi:cation diffusion facilitator CzcD-associated flavoprotein CzcO
VIGTGATGIQLIGEIADKVGELTVFQRRPNWSAPLNNSADLGRGDGRHPRAL